MALTNIGIYDPLAPEAFHQVLRRAEGQKAENIILKNQNDKVITLRGVHSLLWKTDMFASQRVRNRAARRAHWSPVLRADAALKYPLIGVTDTNTKEQWVQYHFQYFCGSTDSAGI